MGRCRYCSIDDTLTDVCLARQHRACNIAAPGWSPEHGIGFQRIAAAVADEGNLGTGRLMSSLAPDDTKPAVRELHP